ncbi:hypothetical protein Fmac_025527 [Flemingia macrophylla]|uniref:Uncharacterized protein n=1 Tax=Flemingia macrophylla TaxID=520843 RepID=A0ABD1LSH1_9FABA
MKEMREHEASLQQIPPMTLRIPAPQLQFSTKTIHTILFSSTSDSLFWNLRSKPGSGKTILRGATFRAKSLD